MPTKTILVEDSQTIRASLVPALFELAEVEVVAFAATESQAKAAFAHDAPEWKLVVIDLFLEVGSGIGVLRGCRDRRADQIALMLTNYATVDFRRRCLELGADGIYDKSTELDAFFDHCSGLTPGASR